MLKTRDRIIALADLQQSARAAINNAQTQPLIITADGRPEAYIIGVDIFDQLMETLARLEEAQIKASVAEGEAQFEGGQFKTLEEALAIAHAARSENQ